MKTFSAMWSDKLGAAIKAASHDVYPMLLRGRDALDVQRVVNIGIDSYLEACYVPDRGDKYEAQGSSLKCSVSPESLPVLVRRLLDDGSDNTMGLASDICSTLEIELI